jgi:hypothetical protein
MERPSLLKDRKIGTKTASLVPFRDRTDRHPGATPNSQVDYLLLKEGLSACMRQFLLPVDVPANQPDGTAPGVLTCPE